MGWARLWGLVLLASALDLSTSLCLHGADRQVSLPERPAWLLYVQLALLPWLGLYAVRMWPVFRQSWVALPVSQLGKLVTTDHDRSASCARATRTFLSI